MKSKAWVIGLFLTVSLSSTIWAADIHRAVEKGNLEKVQKLLHKTPGWVNEKDEMGRTPLQIAAYFGHTELVKYLLSQGAQVNAKDGIQRDTALHLAAAMGSPEICEILLNAGADIDITNNRNDTPLFLAVTRKKKQVAELLLKRGAQVNTKCQDLTPLDMADDQPEMAALLRQYGGVRSELDQRMSKNLPAPKVSPSEMKSFFDSILHNDLAKVGPRLDQQPEWANLKNEDSLSALHFAVASGNFAICDLLVKKGADVNAFETGKGLTPLHIAALNGEKEIAKLLISAGAWVNALDHVRYWTPLHMAAVNGYLEICRLLLAHGALVNLGDKENITPLYIAAEKGSLAVCQLLLENGADINVKTRNGITPLMVAKKNGHNKVVDLLRQQGAVE